MKEGMGEAAQLHQAAQAGIHTQPLFCSPFPHTFSFLCHRAVCAYLRDQDQPATLKAQAVSSALP